MSLRMKLHLLLLLLLGLLGLLQVCCSWMQAPLLSLLPPPPSSSSKTVSDLWSLTP